VRRASARVCLASLEQDKGNWRPSIPMQRRGRGAYHARGALTLLRTAMQDLLRLPFESVTVSDTDPHTHTLSGAASAPMANVN
jgi:hypothetical protein